MKRILIVVDMQKDFVDGALGSAEAIEIVDKVVKKIRHFEGKIIATLDTHTENYLMTQEGSKLPVPHCLKESEGWKLNIKVKEALEEKGYETVFKGSFAAVDLVEKIKEYDPEKLEVELIGLCTDICVVSNALLLKSHFPELKISVDSSCCAGVTPEKHKAALMTMESCQIEIV